VGILTGKCPASPVLSAGSRGTIKMRLLFREASAYGREASKSFRAVPFYWELLTMKNLNYSRSLTESCDPCLSNAAILKLWRYLRLTDSPNFFTPSLLQRGIMIPLPLEKPACRQEGMVGRD
jgi:hypothetical protein